MLVTMATPISSHVKKIKIEETLLQLMLKSFITVFIQCNVGLEDKLTRAPLLGLAKSIYIIHCSKNEAENIRISCVGESMVELLFTLFRFSVVFVYSGSKRYWF